MQRLIPITNKTFEKYTSQWLEVLTQGESVCILFAPKTDRHRRISQLLNSPKLLKKYLKNPAKYKFITIDFDQFIIDDIDDFGDYIANQLNESNLGKKLVNFSNWLAYFKKNKKILVLLVLNGEKLFQREYQPIFLLLASLIEQNPQVQALLFFEKDLTHPDNLRLIATRTAILQNIFYYPLYLKEDTEQFINYLCKKWEMSVPEKIRKELIKACGGHLLLIKQAVRFLKENPRATIKQILTDEQIKMRLGWIYEGFSMLEKKILKKASFGKQEFSLSEKHSLAYLKKLGVLDKKNKLTMPLLQSYLQKKSESETQLVVLNGDILLNNVPVKIFFSRQEYRVLCGFLKSKGELVTRETIAGLIWPTDTDKNYSDWAIDQLIKRLRKKLAKLFISPKMIKTVRGQGYLLAFD